MKKAMGMTWPDLILIASILVIAVLWWVHDLSGSREASLVRIYSGQGLFREIPLAEDAEVQVPGPLGMSIVEIRSGKVFMESSPCMNKVCIHMGRISRSAESILCIPNKVSVTIRSFHTDTDTVTY